MQRFVDLLKDLCFLGKKIKPARTRPAATPGTRTQSAGTLPGFRVRHV